MDKSNLCVLVQPDSLSGHFKVREKILMPLMTSNLEVTLTLGEDIAVKKTFYYGPLEDTARHSGLIFRRRDRIMLVYLLPCTISHAWPYCVHGYFMPHTVLKAS